MPIRPLLQNGAFSPEEIAKISSAFDDCLRELRLVDKTDPVVTLIAKRVLQFADSGVRDPVWLRNAVLASLSNQPPLDKSG
jgi:hypothetical protein